MDLKKRLAQLDRLTRKPQRADTTKASPEESTSPVDRESVLAGLGLQRQETSEGPVWFADHCDSLAPPPDPVVDLSGLIIRDANLRPPVSQLLFLDTETTGLAGGTGTLIFQLGLSWWRSDGLHTRQYFLPGPAHEAAMLVALTKMARNFSVVLTFNGASFDLPLLRTRALLNRLPDPLASLVSWDVLVPSRRLWGNRLDNCRQQTLEQFLCGREREPGDIDGAQIPQTWFDYLAEGRPGLLPNVLTHNHRDMLGMARIFGWICRISQWLNVLPLTAHSWPVDGLAHDRAAGWALGKICEKRSAPVEAASCFTMAWSSGWGLIEEPQMRRRFRRDAIRNLKRCEKWDLVEEVIHDGLESDGDDIVLHCEAAILYEHRLINLDRARQHAVRGADAHRVARLERLLLKRAG